jgi:DNA-binding LacI/PurR family transcriptional regulator
MNLPSRVDFIYELVDAVKRDVIDKADLMPDEWDGEELRRYLADRFEHECNLLARGQVRSSGSSKRLAAYKAACAKRGL